MKVHVTIDRNGYRFTFDNGEYYYIGSPFAADYEIERLRNKGYEVFFEEEVDAE